MRGQSVVSGARRGRRRGHASTLSATMSEQKGRKALRPSTVPAFDEQESDGDGALGRGKRDGQQPWRAVRRDEGEVDDGRGLVSRQAEPLAYPIRVTGNLQAADGDAGRGADGRMHSLVVPLDVERQLRVGHESLDTELTPLELDTVRTTSTALHGLMAQSLLGLRQIIDADNPTEPATAGLGTGTNSLAERCLVGRRVVKHLDDLDIAFVREGKDDVAGAEARVDAAIHGLHTELLGQPLRSGLQPILFDGI